MKKVVAVLVLGVAIFAFSGCAGIAYAPVIPPSGIVYTSTKAPLDVDLKDTSLGRVGKASTYCVLGLVAWGDASTKAAAENGGLSVIDHADYESYSILFGLYSRYTTIVYGK